MRSPSAEPFPLPATLAELLSQSDVTDLCVNGPDAVFVDRGEGMCKVDLSESLPMGTEALSRWLMGQLSDQGKAWDARQPFIDLRLPSGHRLHAVLPPIAPEFPLLSFRRLSSAGEHPRQRPEARAARWADQPSWAFLEREVRAGESMLVSGATGAGKTTLMNDLISAIPSEQRILALEDTPELDPDHPHFLSLQSRNANADGFGEIPLRTLLKQTLRMRPDRLLVGECRGGEILELLQALNTGHRGALATVHANCPRDALRRIELLCLIHGPANLNPALIRELLVGGLRWIVHVKRDPHDPKRRQLVVARLEGREGDTLLLRPMVEFNQ